MPNIRLLGMSQIPDITQLDENGRKRLDMLQTFAARPNPNPAAVQRPLDSISALVLFARHYPLIDRFNRVLDNGSARKIWSDYISDQV